MRQKYKRLGRRSKMLQAYQAKADGGISGDNGL